MNNNIDFYRVWYKNKAKKIMAPRERKAALMIKDLNLKAGSKFLDVGCGQGNFLELIESKLGFEGYGLEYSKDAIKTCRQRGIKIKFADLNLRIPFPNKFFDIVYGGEIIEHLYNPDRFLEECNRVLKSGGYIIITTPNLCCWYNRILMLFGIQPIFIETSTRNKLVGAGILKKLKQDSYPVGHVRIFNFAALRDMLDLYGFKVIKLKGEIFEHFPKPLKFLDKLFACFPKQASNLIVAAVKIK